MAFIAHYIVVWLALLIAGATGFAVMVTKRGRVVFWQIMLAAFFMGAMGFIFFVSLALNVGIYLKNY